MPEKLLEFTKWDRENFPGGKSSGMNLSERKELYNQYVKDFTAPLLTGQGKDGYGVGTGPNDISTWTNEEINNHPFYGYTAAEMGDLDRFRRMSEEAGDPERKYEMLVDGFAREKRRKESPQFDTWWSAQPEHNSSLFDSIKQVVDRVRDVDPGARIFDEVADRNPEIAGIREAPLSHLEQAINAWEQDPERALLGINTEAETDLWNAILGSDYDPIATNTGGITGPQLAQAQSEGVDTGLAEGAYNIADLMALYYGGQAAGDAFAGGQPASAPSGSATNTFNPTNPLANPSGTFTGGQAAGVAGGAAALNNAGSSNNTNPFQGGGMTNSTLDNLLIGGSSLLSGYLSNEATGKGIDEIRRQFDLSRADMAPYREAGVGALEQLQGGIDSTPAGSELPNYAPRGDFEFNLEDDPVYQFQRDEALKATERAMAARGYNRSGNVLDELQKRAIGEAGRYQDNAFNRQLATHQTNVGQDLTNYGIGTDRANTLYGRGQDRLNRLAALAGLGQTTTAGTANLGANAAGNLANLYLQQGQGINNAVQGGLSNYFTNNYLNRGIV